MREKTFKDHFSDQSALYADYRPSYPATLFSELARLAARRRFAWDCATGSGQAAVALTPFFEQVVASDASADQVAQAEPGQGVSYFRAAAEASALAPASVDLITVAQAFHWLDFDRFWPEARRVAAPGAIIAVWCYERTTVDETVDPIVDHFYRQVLDGFWPPERKLIEEGYRSIPFPLEEVELPVSKMEVQWTLDHLLGYFGSWSATARYRRARGEDPRRHISKALADAWGDAKEPKTVRWPLSLRAGRF